VTNDPNRSELRKTTVEQVQSGFSRHPRVVKGGALAAAGG
jgi:hypothetical protein